VNPNLRIAYHEAGHAVASILYGQPLIAVSIRPGVGYSGITMTAPTAQFTFTSEIDPGLSVLFQPTRLRDSLEAEIVMALAGPIAGRYGEMIAMAQEATASPIVGYVPTSPCEQAASGAAGKLAHLSPRDRELVTDAEARDDGAFTDDETAASTLSWALVGEPDEAAAHLAWLRVVARNLVTRRWYQVEALAGALLTHTVLDGASAAGIVHAATPAADA
jgi:hypothetical protein